MAPHYRIMQFPWIAVIILSAISVHSFLYNWKSRLEFDTARSVGAPLERGSGGGQFANIEGNAGVDSGTPVSSVFENLTHQQLVTPVEATDQTPTGSEFVSVLPNTPRMYAPPSGEMQVDIGATANLTMPQFDGVAEGAYPKILNEDSNALGEGQHIFSLRPAGRPPQFEMTLERSRVTGGGEIVVSASPASSIRPLPRPRTLIVPVANSLTPPQEVQTDMVDAAVSEALALFPQSQNETVPSSGAQQPIHTEDSATERTGTVLGLFETNTRRWALVKSSSGRIIILEPGDTVGYGVVSSISNGSIQISNKGSLSEYGLGDDL